MECAMEYAIDYEHLEDELVASFEWERHFNKVKDSANENSLELSDEEFKGFLKLQSRDKDIKWMMHKMSAYKLSFMDALIAYITY